MTKRRRIIILLACGLLAIALSALLFSPKEPSYGGRSFSHWLDLRSSLIFAHQEKEFDDAIRHMGAKVVPYAVRWMVYEPSPAKVFLQRAFKDLPEGLKQILGLDSTWENRSLPTWKVFQILGPEAKAAIPDLVRIMTISHSGLRQQYAAYDLAYIGQEGLPHLLAAMTNEEPKVRGVAAGAMAVLGTNAAPVLPFLIRSLKDPAQEPAAAAAWALGRLKLQPTLVVPALTNCLNHTNALVRYLSIVALAEFGKDALPGLLRCLDDEDEHVIALAAKALGKNNLDPDRVVPLLINRLKAPSPMVRNGAAAGLMEFGTNARAAVPTLVERLNEPEPEVAEMVANALLKIAPEALTNAAAR